MSSCLFKTGILSAALTGAVCCDAPLRKWTNTEGRSFSVRISIATVIPQNTRVSGATSLLKFRFLNYVLRTGEMRTPIAVERNTKAISLSFVRFLQSNFAACILTSIGRIITKARSFSFFIVSRKFSIVETGAIFIVCLPFSFFVITENLFISYPTPESCQPSLLIVSITV